MENARHNQAPQNPRREKSETDREKFIFKAKQQHRAENPYLFRVEIENGMFISYIYISHFENTYKLCNAL